MVPEQKWPEPEWLDGLGSESYTDEIRDEIRRLYTSDNISDDDRERIMAVAERDAGKYAPTTVRNRLSHLRTTASRGDTQLVDHDINSLSTLLDSFRNGAHPDVKAGGIGVFNHQKALRVFYRHHSDLEIDDPMGIEIDDDGGGRDLSPDDLLTQEDVDKLLSHTHNLRDRAFLTLALATGMRLDAMRTLRNRHVEINGRTINIQLNEEEGALKGAGGSKPLLWAKHYFRDWCESHPYRDDPDAALFCPLPDARGLNDPGAEEREPLHKESWRGTLKRMGERAGIEKKLYPHLLRHTAITRMVLEGLSEQKIKQLVDWGADSSQFGTYVNLSEQLSNDSIRSDLGLPTSDEEVPVIGRPTLDRCPECNDRVPTGSERCNTCQAPLTHGEADEHERAQEKARTDTMDTHATAASKDDDIMEEFARELRAKADDPEAIKRLADALGSE